MQVITGCEEKLIANVNAIDRELANKLHFLKKTEIRRKNGQNIKKIVPVFPGYIFLCLPDALTVENYHLLKKSVYFNRFLPNNENILSLTGNDFFIIKKLTSFGSITEQSLATFGLDDKIIVLEGPLKGLEGFITKVDKRKGRVTIVLDLYGEKFPISLFVTYVSKR